ncbi:hypothetical protein AMQ84_27020 [Paenibacillus riograndensis]|uniref:HNH domain-containing protein n=1 Tax=Paenibacillus riograndensis TaxID=483937 RepID=A0A132TJV3_9BACL|nr:hypothetical protein AMQ84_27020 [Paenibacillus riograndensis]
MRKKPKKEIKPWRIDILKEHKRGGLTQRQMGDISDKVRKEVHARSGGICEVRIRCHGSPAVQQAHITGRPHLNHKTTADDLRDSCLACHNWLDETPEGIRYKRQLKEGA